MSTLNLTDALLSIACASLPGEMRPRLSQLLREETKSRAKLAEEVRRIVQLLRVHAKSMESYPLLRRTDEELMAMGALDHATSIRKRAGELRTDAEELERTAMAIGLLPADGVNAGPRLTTLRGVLAGLDVTEEEIDDAKRNLFKATDDNGIF